MTRGKLQLKTITNPERRRITFCKRKAGLLKKASELALLCDAEVALLIFSPSGKLYEFGSPSMNRIMEKYQEFSGSIRHHTPLSDTIEMLHLEVENLRRKMINLKKNYKHMIGEDLDSLSFKELKHLEKKINLGGRKLHLRKDQILREYIGSSKSKEKSLEAENANICKKVESLEVENANLGKKVASSSASERNWSTYSFIHSVKRNRLLSKRAENLVYVHSNLRLLSHKQRDYTQGETKMWDIEPEHTDLDAPASQLLALTLDDSDTEQTYSASASGIGSSNVNVNEEEDEEEEEEEDELEF